MKTLIMNKIRALFRRKPPKVWPYKQTQKRWVTKMADEILSEAIDLNQRSGMRLYCRLPGEMQKVVNNVWFDPYNTWMDLHSLMYWLTNHIFFDQFGNMIILHDHGEIIWQSPGIRIDPMFHMVYKEDGDVGYQ